MQLCAITTLEPISDVAISPMRAVLDSWRRRQASELAGLAARSIFEGLGDLVQCTAGPRGFSYLPHSSADWRRRRLRCLGLLVELVLRLRLHSRPARQLALLRLSMRTVHLALLTDLADLRWRFRTHGCDVRTYVLGEGNTAVPRPVNSSNEKECNMSTIHMPGFTASASLETTGRGYWGAADATVTAHAVVRPARIIHWSDQCPSGCVKTSDPLNPCWCPAIVSNPFNSRLHYNR